MPTYEYACDACKHGFEIEQRITADFLTVCPKCKKHALTRLVGTGNFILKGSGWYADLYSGGGNKTPEPTGVESGAATPAVPAAVAAVAATGATPTGAGKEPKPEAPSPAKAATESPKAGPSKKTAKTKGEPAA